MNKKQEWELWEDYVTDSLQAQKVKASGRMTLFKGDVKSDTFLVDCKYTSGRSYAVTASFWEEVCMWARNEMREPAIAIRCAAPNAEIAVVRESWYCYCFEKATAGIITKNGLSKSVSANVLAEKDEFIFEVGGHRLVALPYAQFEWKVLSNEGKQA